MKQYPPVVDTTTLHLKVRNDLPALESARRALLDFVAPLGMAPQALYRLELVLEEALMNRLWHAWPEGGEHHTALAVEVLPDALLLRFEDDGRAFDPLQAAPPARPASLGEAAPGGLGLLLTRLAVREARYERVGGHNRLCLEIARSGA